MGFNVRNDWSWQYEMFRWSFLCFSRGQMICIGHEDGKTIVQVKDWTTNWNIDIVGNVIIGSVEGSRVAGKNLRNNKLAKVEVRFYSFIAWSIVWTWFDRFSGHPIVDYYFLVLLVVKFICMTLNWITSYVDIHCYGLSIFDNRSKLVVFSVHCIFSAFVKVFHQPKSLRSNGTTEVMD